MYVYIYIYTYIYTWTRALTRLVLVTTRVATVSNDFVWRLSGAHHPAFWVPTAHLRFLVWRLKGSAFGPGRVFPRSQGKKDHDLWSPMVQEVMRNGPGYISTKESWYHEWWEMVPTSIWMSIPSTDLSTRSIHHGRYRRSTRIYLRENTVDIDDRQGFIYG